jgi:hypothetical protein
MPSQLSFLPVYNAMSMQRGDSTVQYNTFQRLFTPHFPNQPVFRFASFLAFCYRPSSAYRSVRRHNARCRRVAKKTYPLLFAIPICSISPRISNPSTSRKCYNSTH